MVPWVKNASILAPEPNCTAPPNTIYRGAESVAFQQENEVLNGDKVGGYA